MAKRGGKPKQKPGTPVITNRKARHEYHIEGTLECGMRLVGTEVKSVRNGQVSLGEGYVRAGENPLVLELHGVHIAEYPPAGPARQHNPTRTRRLLASKREIAKLVTFCRDRGATLVPLKVYFERGVAKLLVGMAHGKGKADKRQDITEREAKRDMERAMKRG